MPYYKGIFKLAGGIEIKAKRDYVPDLFFEALARVNLADLVALQPGGFVLDLKLHEILDISGSFNTYALVGLEVTEGLQDNSAFHEALLHKLKAGNHARPLANNLHYDVFAMEFIDLLYDDD